MPQLGGEWNRITVWPPFPIKPQEIDEEAKVEEETNDLPQSQEEMLHQLEQAKKHQLHDEQPKPSENKADPVAPAIEDEETKDESQSAIMA